MSHSTTSQYQPHVVRMWLTTVHGQSSGHLWIGSAHDRFRGRAVDTCDPHWVERAGQYIDQLDATGTPGIYLRTTTLRTPPEHGRGGDNDSHTLPGLAADLDMAGPGHKTAKPLPDNPDKARLIVEESGLPDPSIWIHSGGGLYAWWLLDQPHTIGADLDRIKRLAARWQDPLAAASERLGWSYGRLGDLARILRIPGTVNRKSAMPAPATCRILADTGRRYTLENLRGCLTDALAAMPAPEPVRIPARTAARRNGDLTPWDDFEARTDWADILLPHGWALHSAHGRMRYWTRPGKDRRDGFSASTGRGQHDNLWVFTDAAAGFEPNRLYTKFGAYRQLNHGGNGRDAARELRRLGYGATHDQRRAA